MDLVVGVANFYPPFVMKSDNKTYYGFDISLVNRICKDLKVTCKYKSMNFNQLNNAILAGSIDLAASSIVITPARKEVVTFSIPYMISNGRYLARKAIIPKEMTDSFLNNKRIGIEEGTVYQEYVEKKNPKNAKIMLRSETSELVEALLNNKLDVVILDNPMAIWWAIRSSGIAKVAGKPFKVGMGLGIVVSKRARKYLPNINKAIENWQKDGTFEKLYNMYFNPSHTQI